VAEEELDPILIQVTVPLPISMIFRAFVEPAQLSGWLAQRAVVTPQVGGPYELEFVGETPFVSRGTVRTITPDVDVGFDWQAPPTYAPLMNEPAPKTHVYVRLQESPEGIDVTLEHAGWGSGEAWEEARSWHFHFWDEHLSALKDYLIKQAYG
jgi:uncharacterized protein YndB with AHSA1/START domain